MDIRTRTIVMIHGMWGGAWYWGNFKHYFEKRGYQCHTPTLRYHDIDPKEKPNPALGTTSLLDYAQDIEEYIRNLNDEPILMGHSMGALLAQMLGARRLSKGLILLSPAAPKDIMALKFSIIKSFWFMLSRWAFWRNPFRLSLDEAVYSMIHLLPENDQRATYKRFVYESGKVATELAFRLKTLQVDESKITCPVLIVCGSDDRITPSSVAKKIASKYKAVSAYKEFDNHAHWIIGEPGWQKIAEFIHEWLNNIS